MPVGFQAVRVGTVKTGAPCCDASHAIACCCPGSSPQAGDYNKKPAAVGDERRRRHHQHGTDVLPELVLKQE